MEFLKELFGDQPLTYDQLAEKVTKHGMKLADLSTGRYVGKDKYDALSAEKNSLNQRLTEANTKLEGYDPDWKTKAQQAQSQADAEVAKIKRSYLLRDQTANIKFSSESARKAFLSDLEAMNLPVQEDKVLGLEDFIQQYRESDPGAFLSEEKPPKISGPTPGPAKEGTGKEQANAAFRALFNHD